VWHAFALAAWCEATLGEGPDALRELIDEVPRNVQIPAATAPARAVGVSN
jgi:hypothetical protein